MSVEHSDHGHDSHGKSSGGLNIDLGISSMIAGFFGGISGANALEGFVKGKGGGGGHHDDHGHH